MSKHKPSMQLVFGAFLLLFGIYADANVVLDVTEFGAVGDSITDDSASIKAAINAATEMLTSPVTILFPFGKTFLSDPINITSYMTLEINGMLLSKASAGDWPEIAPLPSYQTSEDRAKLQYQAVIYAKDATDITITGNGTVHGQGEWWWQHYQNRTLVSGRPNMIQLVNCTNVVVSHVTLKDSPFWCLHPVYCSNVHIHHISIISRMYAPNSDGIDPDSSRNVLIEYNNVSCGDDHIAIKAGRCGDASTPNSCLDRVWRDGTYQTDNVTVRHNVFGIGMGIAIGSESSGGIRNVKIHDNVVGVCKHGHCEDGCCGWGPALHIKTTPTRGGVIENVVFENNVVYNSTSFILMELNYQTSKGSIPTDYHPTQVRNISFIHNRAVGNYPIGASWHCVDGDACEDIVVVNTTVDHTESPWDCHYINTFQVSGNTPPGLEECMANSMKVRASESLRNAPLDKMS